MQLWNNQSKLVRHLQAEKHAVWEESQFTCLICGKTFRKQTEGVNVTALDVIGHINSAHSNKNSGVTAVLMEVVSPVLHLPASSLEETPIGIDDVVVGGGAGEEEEFTHEDAIRAISDEDEPGMFYDEREGEESPEVISETVLVTAGEKVNLLVKMEVSDVSEDGEWECDVETRDGLLKVHGYSDYGLKLEGVLTTNDAENNSITITGTFQLHLIGDVEIVDVDRYLLKSDREEVVVEAVDAGKGKNVMFLRTLGEVQVSYDDGVFSEYKGHWALRQRSGNGVLLFRDGRELTATFVNGEHSGDAMEMRFPDDSIYKGGICYSMETPTEGQFYYCDGSYIDGQFISQDINVVEGIYYPACGTYEYNIPFTEEGRNVVST